MSRRMSLPSQSRHRLKRWGFATLSAVVLATGFSGCDTERTEAPSKPLPGGQCQARYGHSCYGPIQMRRAYGLDQLAAQGLDGRGTTIAIVIPGANPNVQQDLDHFSDEFGLPRARIEVVNRGAQTADPQEAYDEAAAYEAAVDLQIAHAAAPGAHLIYLQAANGELHGIGDAVRAIGWLVRHRHVDVISMSWGAAEPALMKLAGGRRQFDELRQSLVEASQRGTTLIAATGDYGSGGHDPTGSVQGRTVAWPASDPLVTAVGGSLLRLDEDGRRTAPDEVWGSAAWPTSQRRGTGSGRSELFGRPAHQAPARALLGEQRGVPDLVANAADDSSVWIHSSKYGQPGRLEPGWTPAAGTSIAAPLLAGITAIAAQRAGRPLGDLGPALYRLRPEDAGLVDLASGCNHTKSQRGYCAHPGYDLASGLGAVQDASRLVHALSSP